MRPIDHIGILVVDLEEAIERWSAATGYTFSPVRRYRTDRYRDGSNPLDHPHNARFAVTREGPPRIELLEATGEGTHSLAHLGVHHLAVTGYADLENEVARLRELSVEGVGDARTRDDRLLLHFTDPDALDGIRFELVSTVPGPILRDDGSLPPTDPATGRPSLWS